MTAPCLARKIFKTSRLAEFCSQKELVNQTGHAIEDWPLVVLKELVDNALDACEEASVPPVIMTDVTDNGIAVTDTGPGISPETVQAILDFTSRTSSREAYVSPTRGAQGNALKTLLAMPFALDGQRGETTIESRSFAHRITFSIDPVRREPRIAHVCEDAPVRNGTWITVKWPGSARSILAEAQARFLQIAEDYTWINPHLALSLDWNQGLCPPATDKDWRKWLPSDPTSPHWYDEARLARLIAAHIAHAEDHNIACPTVREFISEFRGLSATAKAKAICEAVAASRMSLAEFYGDAERVGALLSEMRNASRAIKPRDLGLIGAEHLRAKFGIAGAAPESFSYKKIEIEHQGVPYLAEAAFGYCSRDNNKRLIITGINWSPAIGDPFRSIGSLDESLGAVLTEQRAGPSEPIVTVVHLACPRIEYLDRGKSSVNLPSQPGQAIVILVESVTAKWARQCKAEERDRSARLRRSDRMVHYVRPVSIKEAAYRVMPEAYMAASANGTLPANPRQIMYAARPQILAIADRDSLDDRYFCQNLLPNFMLEHPASCASWDIIWDDRGHFIEPHTGRTFGVGTLNVRKYIASYASPRFEEAGFADATIKTSGPERRYGGSLYIEKEGFLPIPRTGKAGRETRHWDYVLQRHVGHCREDADRSNMRALWHPALDPA